MSESKIDMKVMKKNMNKLPEALRMVVLEFCYNDILYKVVKHGDLNLVKKISKFSSFKSSRMGSVFYYSGHLNQWPIFKWVFENCCKHKWDIVDMRNASGFEEDYRRFVFMHRTGGELSEDLCKFAVERENWRCLSYMLRHGCNWTEKRGEKVALIGDLKTLQIAHEKGCKFNNKTVIEAAKGGYVNCLKFLHKKVGLKMSTKAVEYAASNGHLDCLKYLHENGAKWAKLTTQRAARYGHLDCLKYAHENGCPWHKKTLSACFNDLKCLMYVIEHGCPLNMSREKAIKLHEYNGEWIKCVESLQFD